MSLTQFYNGRMIMDYTGKLAPVRIRIDQNQSEAASNALSNIINLLSNGKQIVETGEYTDYQIIQSFPDNSANNYNCYRMTLVDNVDSSVKEYVYIPSAKLELLTDNLEYIPSGSSLFNQIASYIQPYYKSRLNNGCTLTAIEYVVQRNTIFPSQVGTATFAPQQVKTTNITANGTYTVEPDSGYILGRNIINVNVGDTPSVPTLLYFAYNNVNYQVDANNFEHITTSSTLTLLRQTVGVCLVPSSEGFQIRYYVNTANSDRTVQLGVTNWYLHRNIISGNLTTTDIYSDKGLAFRLYDYAPTDGAYTVFTIFYNIIAVGWTWF